MEAKQYAEKNNNQRGNKKNTQRQMKMETQWSKTYGMQQKQF